MTIPYQKKDRHFEEPQNGFFSFLKPKTIEDWITVGVFFMTIGITVLIITVVLSIW